MVFRMEERDSMGYKGGCGEGARRRVKKNEEIEERVLDGGWVQTCCKGVRVRSRVEPSPSSTLLSS